MNKLTKNEKTEPHLSGDEIHGVIIPHIEFLCRRDLDSLLNRLEQATTEYQIKHIHKLIDVEQASLNWLTEAANSFSASRLSSVDKET